MTWRTMLMALTCVMGLISVILPVSTYSPFAANAELLPSGRSVSLMKTGSTPKSGSLTKTGSSQTDSTRAGVVAPPHRWQTRSARPGASEKPFDPIAQMRALGKLSTQAQELDSGTTAALKELQAAQRELQRRRIAADRLQQRLLADRRRDALRRAVVLQLAIEKKQQRDIANANAAELARKKDLIRAANAKANAKVDEASFVARQLSAARPVRTMARPVLMQVAPGQGQGQGQGQGAMQGQNAEQGQGAAHLALGKAALGKEGAPNGKVSDAQSWSKNIGRHIRGSRQAMTSDGRLQASDDQAAHASNVVIGMEDREHSKKNQSDKWIENAVADNAARGAVPTIWNISAETLDRADPQWSGEAPTLYVNSVGAVLLRSDPGTLISRKLIQNLQRELRRVGCAPGRVDGKWGQKGRQALQRFNARINLVRESSDPDQEALRRIRATKRAVCRRSHQQDQKRRKAKRISRLSRGAKSFKKRIGKKKPNKIGAKKNLKAAIRKETWEKQIFDASL